MNKYFNILEQNLCRPIIENLPFFVLFSVLLLPHTATGFLDDILNHFSQNKFSDSIGIFVFNVSVVIAFADLLCLILYYTKSSVVKVLSYFLVLLIFSVNLYLRVCFGTVFTSNTMLLIIETNKNEALEFFETFLVRPVSIAVIITIILTILLLVVIEKWYHKKNIELRSKLVRRVFSMSIAIVLSLAAIEIVNYANSFRNQTFSSYEKLLSDYPKYTRMDYFRRVINSSFFLYLSGADNGNAIDITEKETSSVLFKPENDSLTIIVVIGESFIKSHASVYGYPLNTTPYMSNLREKGNLTIFNKAITTSDHTSISLRNFFSCNSVGDGGRWCEAPFFPALFKASGYDVFFWDNQYNKYASSDFSFALNAYIHNPTISKLSYNLVNETNFSYDGELVKNFQDSCLHIINKQANNSLLLFHLMGQHFKTEKRYPNTAHFCRFNADSIRKSADYLTESKKEEIAKYDNAVLYNDYVLSNIIEPFMNKNAIMLFISDHGELVYDVSDVVGRTLTIEQMTPAEMTHYYEIPMIIWYSDQYKNKHPDLVCIIENNKDNPLMSDNICQLLFHIGNIQSKWYQPQKDVLHLDYICPPRIIENTVNYDNILTQ